MDHDGRRQRVIACVETKIRELLTSLNDVDEDASLPAFDVVSRGAANSVMEGGCLRLQDGTARVRSSRVSPHLFVF
jgi:hypothetical protein